MEAKLPKFGGNPWVVVAEPEIWTARIDASCDFFILACDGIFDKLTNQECVETVWETLEDNKKATCHEQVGDGVEMIIKKSAAWRSLDNITAVIIGLSNFSTMFSGPKKVRSSIKGGSTIPKSYLQLSSTNSRN